MTASASLVHSSFRRLPKFDSSLTVCRLRCCRTGSLTGGSKLRKPRCRRARGDARFRRGDGRPHDIVFFRRRGGLGRRSRFRGGDGRRDGHGSGLGFRNRSGRSALRRCRRRRRETDRQFRHPLFLRFFLRRQLCCRRFRRKFQRSRLEPHHAERQQDRGRKAGRQKDSADPEKKNAPVPFAPELRRLKFPQGDRRPVLQPLQQRGEKVAHFKPARRPVGRILVDQFFDEGDQRRIKVRIALRQRRGRLKRCCSRTFCGLPTNGGEPQSSSYSMMPKL